MPESSLKELEDDEIENLIESSFKQKTWSVEKKKEDIIEAQKRFVQLKISVIDNGVGISEEGLKNLFVDFGKLDENSGRNKQGTGLGLSICKDIVEKMGGAVDVKS